MLQRYHNELAVAEFLSGRDTYLSNKVQGHILGGDTVPYLFATLSRVCRVSIGGDYSSGVSSGVDNSAMLAIGYSRGGGYRRVMVMIQEEDVDAKRRVNVSMFIVVETLIHQISAGTRYVT